MYLVFKDMGKMQEGTLWCRESTGKQRHAAFFEQMVFHEPLSHKFVLHISIKVETNGIYLGN